MNTFNKKSLFVALAATGALGAGAAQAVSVNPDGLGQVLIYPYYTTQSVLNSPWNSLLSVVNTTGSTKAVKIRFREGKASAEVLDFNIFLRRCVDFLKRQIVHDPNDSLDRRGVPRPRIQERSDRRRPRADEGRLCRDFGDGHVHGRQRGGDQLQAFQRSSERLLEGYRFGRGLGSADTSGRLVGWHHPGERARRPRCHG
jgi:hypothetical protein